MCSSLSFFYAHFLIIVVNINCKVHAGLFSAADRCFPRARLQPPRGTHSAGSSDTCCSRRSQRSSASNNYHNSESDLLVLLQNPMLAKEIHEDSLKKKITFSACDVSLRSFPCPTGKRRR